MHVAVNMEDNKAYTLRAKFIDHILISACTLKLIAQPKRVKRCFRDTGHDKS